MKMRFTFFLFSLLDEIGRKIGLKLVQEFSLRRLPPPPLPEGQKAEKKEAPKGDDGKEKKVEKEEKRDPSLPPKPMPWLKGACLEWTDSFNEFCEHRVVVFAACSHDVETKCLHEQGITQEEELEYRKKYFFADDQVEKEDAFTLHVWLQNEMGLMVSLTCSCCTSSR